MDVIFWIVLLALFIIVSILIKRFGAYRLKLIGVVMFFLIVVKSTFAQHDMSTISIEAKNAWFLEAAGNGGIISGNYERFLFQNVGLRVGLGTVYMGFTAPIMIDFCTVPIMIDFYFGDDNKIELGFGIVYSAGEDLDGREFEGVNGTATIGYRYQPVNGGSIFRIGLTPYFSGDGIQFWLGISFGNTF